MTTSQPTQAHTHRTQPPETTSTADRLARATARRLCIGLALDKTIMLSISLLVVFIAFSLIVSTEEHIFRRLRASDYSSEHDDDSEFDSHEDDEETQATNINEMFDYALALLWPLVTKNKWDMTSLPDINEGFSYKPLFINYNAGILLHNGMLWNIQKIARYGDAFMVLDNKVLRFNGNLQIEKVNFSYDVKAGFMGLGPTVSIDGTVVETILAGEFSIRLNDTNLNLDELKIVSLGHIRVQLKSVNLLRSVSEPFLTTISQLFRARISMSAAGGIKEYIRNLLHYANGDDLFQLKRNLNLLLHFHS